MKLLDLYCGAGGAAMGYRQAGWDVVGIDIKEQPRYPFEFRQGDIVKMMSAGALDLDEFDAVHASPPCQLFSSHTQASGKRAHHVDALTPTRQYLQGWGGLWVIENVPTAPLRQPLVLCGSEFGLSIAADDGGRWHLRRHRLFESSMSLMGAGGCYCRLYAKRFMAVAGHGTDSSAQHTRGKLANKAQAAALMGIDWMTLREMAQAIPPAYTEHVGAQLLAMAGAHA